MKQTIKLITIALMSVLILMLGANAVPTITGLSVDKSGGSEVILVSFSNANLTTGTNTALSFTIEELGTTKSLGFFQITNNVTQTYNLVDITNSYSLLQKGNTYKITATSSNNSLSTSFLFGNIKQTTGLNLILDRIDVNGEQLNNADTLQVLNGEKLSVKLRISALANIDNARLKFELDGYEHSLISTSTDIISMVAGKTYIQNLEIQLPSDMNTQKDYILRISGANDLTGVTYKEFKVFVDTQRHRVDILDLVMTPSTGVEAGQNVIANVRLKNMGQKIQESVKVTVAIPELGVSESNYVSNLNTLTAITSNDVLLFVPENAAVKTYDVIVTLSYNDGYTESVNTYPLTVTKTKAVVKKNLLVSFGSDVNLVSGKATTFPVVIANPNFDSKPISIATGSDSWADVVVTPSLAMVKGGESVTFTVSVTPKAGVTAVNDLTLSVKEGSNLIEDIKVSTYTAPAPVSSTSFTNLILISLLVIAIIVFLAIVIKISKKKNDYDEEEEYTSSKEYY